MAEKIRPDIAQIARIAEMMREQIHRQLRDQGLSEEEIEELEEAFD